MSEPNPTVGDKEQQILDRIAHALKGGNPNLRAAMQARDERTVAASIEMIGRLCVAFGENQVELAREIDRLNRQHPHS